MKRLNLTLSILIVYLLILIFCTIHALFHLTGIPLLIFEGIFVFGIIVTVGTIKSQIKNKTRKMF